MCNYACKPSDNPVREMPLVSPNTVVKTDSEVINLMPSVTDIQMGKIGIGRKSFLKVHVLHYHPILLVTVDEPAA